MYPTSRSRRRFVQTLALGAAGAAALSVSHADSPKLDVNDPAARALGYVESAAQVDVKKYPTFVPGSNCDNCLQLQGKAGDSYRPCGIFPGKLVAASGWCSSWTAEM